MDDIKGKGKKSKTKIPSKLLPGAKLTDEQLLKGMARKDGESWSKYFSRTDGSGCRPGFIAPPPHTWSNRRSIQSTFKFKLLRIGGPQGVGHSVGHADVSASVEICCDCPEDMHRFEACGGKDAGSCAGKAAVESMFAVENANEACYILDLGYDKLIKHGCVGESGSTIAGPTKETVDKRDSVFDAILAARMNHAYNTPPKGPHSKEHRFKWFEHGEDIYENAFWHAVGSPAEIMELQPKKAREAVDDPASQDPASKAKATSTIEAVATQHQENQTVADVTFKFEPTQAGKILGLDIWECKAVDDAKDQDPVSKAKATSTVGWTKNNTLQWKSNPDPDNPERYDNGDFKSDRAYLVLNTVCFGDTKWDKGGVERTIAGTRWHDEKWTDITPTEYPNWTPMVPSRYDLYLWYGSAATEELREAAEKARTELMCAIEQNVRPEMIRLKPEINQHSVHHRTWVERFKRKEEDEKAASSENASKSDDASGEWGDDFDRNNYYLYEITSKHDDSSKMPSTAAAAVNSSTGENISEPILSDLKCREIFERSAVVLDKKSAFAMTIKDGGESVEKTFLWIGEECNFMSGICVRFISANKAMVQKSGALESDDGNPEIERDGKDEWPLCSKRHLKCLSECKGVDGCEDHFRRIRTKANPTLHEVLFYPARKRTPAMKSVLAQNKEIIEGAYKTWLLSNPKFTCAEREVKLSKDSVIVQAGHQLFESDAAAKDDRTAAEQQAKKDRRRQKKTEGPFWHALGDSTTKGWNTLWSDVIQPISEQLGATGPGSVPPHHFGAMLAFERGIRANFMRSATVAGVNNYRGASGFAMLMNRSIDSDPQAMEELSSTVGLDPVVLEFFWLVAGPAPNSASSSMPYTTLRRFLSLFLSAADRLSDTACAIILAVLAHVAAPPVPTEDLEGQGDNNSVSAGSTATTGTTNTTGTSGTGARVEETYRNRVSGPAQMAAWDTIPDGIRNANLKLAKNLLTKYESTLVDILIRFIIIFACLKYAVIEHEFLPSFVQTLR